ncbi:MAG: DAK2 domain-containing protein [Parasporobacterium sp.]|nr:DAK2 domain-containing protein [Parasporobacterium sp.]
MLISMKIACENMTDCPWPKDFFDNIVDTFINKSHGNSGTILTMFFLGMADALPAGRDIDGFELAHAYISGANSAYNSIPDIVEGTILTLMKKTSDACISFMSETENDPSAIWDRICREAYSVLPLTAYQNPSLKNLHVPDSGAAGFCIILDSFRSAFMHKTDSSVSAELEELLPGEEINSITDFKINIPFRYCFEIVIGHNILNSDEDTQKIVCSLRNSLADMGDCLIIVPRRNNIKIHIHTNDTDGVICIAGKFGNILSHKSDDMLAAILN